MPFVAGAFFILPLLVLLSIFVILILFDKFFFDGDTFIDIEPFKVKAIDTNGAGDMFAGAFLYALATGHTYASAGKLAAMAASRVVGQFGPRLKWHQTQEVKNLVFGA